MRILVTGVSGFVGNYVARFLAQSGFDVVGTHRRETALLAELALRPGIRLVRADLRDAARLPGPFEGIIHIAATSPTEGTTTEQILSDNVPSILALIDAARDWNTRAFIFFSSLSIHGRITNPIVDENCPIVCPNAYGMTKYLGELVLAEQAHRIPGLALRLPGVLGPRAHRNWLSAMAAKLRDGVAVSAFNLDLPFNNAVHVADITDLVAATLRRGWKGFDAVVLGAQGTISVRDAIERLAIGLGVPAKIESVSPAKPSYILSSAAAIERWGYDPMEIGAMIDRYADEVARTG